MNAILPNAGAGQPVSTPPPDELPFRVTDACVAHCTFCDLHIPRRTPDLATDAVLAKLRGALAVRRPKRLVLTGGEPALHPRLAALIELARQLGCEQVELETLGVPLANLARVQALAQAGLTGVRMTLLGPEDEAVEPIARLGGVVTAQRLAVEHLREVQLSVAAQTPVNKLTVPLLSGIASLLGAMKIKRWVLQPYIAAGQGAPDRWHEAPRPMENALQTARARARGLGAEVAVPPGTGWHWCAFVQPHKLPELLVRSGARGRVHPSACSGCAARGQCPGVDASLAARFGNAVVSPLADVRTAAWLPVHAENSAAGADASALNDKTPTSDRHQVLPIERAGAQGGRVHELVLRIVHQCNQRCGFCWVDFAKPAMDLPQIAAQLKASVFRGKAARTTFTGGEPTLHPELAAAIALARDLHAPSISLQTNAARIDLALAKTLQQAGLTDALVSLHADNAADSDRLTAAPGTWARTVMGIAALCAAGVQVKINHVLTRQNGEKFPSFVRFVAAHLAHPNLKVTVAVAGHIDGGPIDKTTLPKHTTLGPHVAQGLRLARELGVPMVGLTHPCGLIPCTLPDPHAALRGHELGKPADGERNRDGSYKLAACATCAFDKHCFGLRNEYVAMFGWEEIKPVAGAPYKPSPPPKSTPSTK